MVARPNSYSPEWFEFFHVGIDPPSPRLRRDKRATEFVASCATLPEFRKVLDVCCGMGRHARALSNLGYSVVGVDRDPDVISQARKLGGGRTNSGQDGACPSITAPQYVIADIRDYTPDSGAFDVAIVMSQSFGYFDAATNRDVLGRLSNGVREGGRVIVDLWNPEFFVAHQGGRELTTPSGIVRENKRVEGDRLFVELEYPSGNRERFEWQLFSPAQMTEFARSVGFELVVSCTDFDAEIPPSAEKPRIQFGLVRAGLAVVER
jgi:SAM-dependent methyltransferase